MILSPDQLTRLRALLLFLAAEGVAVAVLVIGLEVGMPWIAIVCAVLIVLEAASTVRRNSSSSRTLMCLWMLTAVGIGSLFIFRQSVQIVEYAHAWSGLLVALAIGAAACKVADAAARGRWERLGYFWAWWGVLVWLRVSYFANHAFSFHASLAVGFGLLLLLKRRFALPFFGVQIVNTLLLLVVVVPVVDRLIRPTYRLDLLPDTRGRFYSYEAARQDPIAFRRWWKYFVDQWYGMARQINIADPGGVLPFRLGPGRHAPFFQSTISINSSGFRGKEILQPKGNAYRIVALGESTTFGCTLNPEDRPWPEWLEEIIARKISSQRRVEVINAGVASYTLENNVNRLVTDMLPLKPDLIISYHGVNGFHWFDASLRPIRGEAPPAFQERPLWLLANAEHRIRLFRYNARLRHAGNSRNPASVNPLATPYGDEYEHLIRFAKANGIRLALANFSMAVTPQSDRDVIEFYRGGFPQVYNLIEANVVHSKLIDQLMALHPELISVDSHPGLDGSHEDFIDLVHFAESGREKLAENIFAGIRPLLELELRGRTTEFGP